jgi:hypothetical protein
VHEHKEPVAGTETFWDYTVRGMILCIGLAVQKFKDSKIQKFKDPKASGRNTPHVNEPVYPVYSITTNANHPEHPSIP